MVKATHKPPARVRYEQSHPTVSCRLDKDTHGLLKQRLEDLGGVSFADFVKDSLGLLQQKMSGSPFSRSGTRYMVEPVLPGEKDRGSIASFRMRAWQALRDEDSEDYGAPLACRGLPQSR